MSDYKYTILYNRHNVLTHRDDAIRGEKYKMYIEDDLLFVFKQGLERSFFSLINEGNPFAELNNKNTSNSSESPEHYDAKMKIAKELCYYDTIFNKTIYFDKVVPEKKVYGDKRPDLKCYIDDELVLIIEILHTNKKTEEDLKQLRLAKVPVVEIDINYENKCKHLILSTLLESNNREIERVKRENAVESSRIKERGGNEIREIEGGIEQFKNEIEKKASIIRESRSGEIDKITEELWECNREFREIIEKSESGIKEVSEQIENVENENKSIIYKIKKNISIYRQKGRERRVKSKRDFVEIQKQIEKSIEFYRERRETIKNQIRIIEQRDKTNVRIKERIHGLVSDVDRAKKHNTDLEQTFGEIAKDCELEWFANKFISFQNINKIKELIYWTS